MGRQKPKINRKGDIYEPKGYDLCQTPAYAVEPLIPYLKGFTKIWEPARGKGYMVKALAEGLHNSWIIGTDIQTGHNFINYEPVFWECLVTNPPYSIKYKWLKRSYELGKPFALLMPVEVLGAQTAQKLLKEYGFEVMLLDGRVDFEMPSAGYSGHGAQFSVMWLTWNILPKQLLYGSISKGKRSFKLKLMENINAT